MSLELVFADTGILQHGAGSTITGGVFTITSSPDSKIKAEGKSVFFNEISFSFSGGSFPGLVPGSVVGSGTILPSSLKTSNSVGNVMREGDSVIMNATGTIPPPAGGTGPAVGPVELGTPGQTKVTAE